MSRTTKKETFLKVGNAVYWAAGRTAPRVKIPFLNVNQNFLLWCFLLVFVSVFLEDPTMHQSRLKRYLRTLRWAPLPVGVGFALIAFQRFRFVRKREASRVGQLEPCECLADEWEVEAYKLLPLRSLSRTWGWINSIELPSWSRNTVIGSYARTFGCNMGEAEVEEINQYRCLSDFFRRRLKAGVRPIDTGSSITSPVDGTVLYKGMVSCGSIEQVKGVTYSAKRFLGPNCWSESGPLVLAQDSEECFHNSCLHNPRKNNLYHIAIYLAPGDYHRFHSPTDWSVTFRRHFSGDLLSVSPSIVNWVKDLFVINERVCYVGHWKHGFFSMTAVGATNVGSILVPFDESLKTNKLSWTKDRSFIDVYFDEKTVRCEKGAEFGQFSMGSTIVLIFEAPKDSVLSVQPGQRVLVGQSLLNESVKSSSGVK